MLSIKAQNICIIIYMTNNNLFVLFLKHIINKIHYFLICKFQLCLFYIPYAISIPYVLKIENTCLLTVLKIYFL